MFNILMYSLFFVFSFFVAKFMFFVFKQKTAYDMRISDWSQTCALPILLSRMTPMPSTAADTASEARSNEGWGRPGMVSLFSENQFAQVILLNWDSIRVRLSNCRVIGTPGRNNVGEHKGAMCSAPSAIDVTPGRSRGGPYEMAMSSSCMRVRSIGSAPEVSRIVMPGWVCMNFGSMGPSHLLARPGDQCRASPCALGARATSPPTPPPP